MWVSGTQHMPFSEGQWKENGGKWGWRNFTNTSWFSGSTEVTVSLQKLKNSTGFRIWLFIGHWRLALAASLLRVPPMQSHGDFSWLVAKKNHKQETSKSCSWLTEVKKVFTILILSWTTIRKKKVPWTDSLKWNS